MTGILVDAVRHARHAPSIFNTQPWQWRIEKGAASLWPEAGRWLEHTDPDGRLLLLSCGAAVHHAAVTVLAQGWQVHVDHLPGGPGGPLARLRLDAPARTTRIGVAGWLWAGWWQGRAARARLAAATGPEPEELAGAVARRRTDRRAFSSRPLSHQTLAELRRAAAGQGVSLHSVTRDEVPLLAAMTARAAEDAANHPWRKAELAHWTHRPARAGDGVPAVTAVEEAPRRVPIRDFVAAGPLRRPTETTTRHSGSTSEPTRTTQQQATNDNPDPCHPGHDKTTAANTPPGSNPDPCQPENDEIARSATSGSRGNAFSTMRGGHARPGIETGSNSGAAGAGRGGIARPHAGSGSDAGAGAVVVGGIAGLEAGPGSDAGASYVVVCGTGDEPVDWLRAGEAVSALLLTATARGVASSVMSEVIESPRARKMLAGMIGGLRPYLVVRLGYPMDRSAPPAAPRRRPDAHLTGA